MTDMANRLCIRFLYLACNVILWSQIFLHWQLMILHYDGDTIFEFYQGKNSGLVLDIHSYGYYYFIGLILLDHVAGELSF